MSNSTEAGRELDALVAERVMGWTVERRVDLEGQPFEVWSDPQGWRYGPDPKPFSTDIAAAWDVVAKADECELWNHTGKVWGCRLIFGDRDGAAVKCPTAPLAICRAALACVSPSAETSVAPTRASGEKEG